MKAIDEYDIMKALKSSPICIDELSRNLNIKSQDLEVFLQEYIINRKTDNYFDNELHKTKVKIFVDGGSRGNPGESGLGIVFLNDNVKKGYFFYNGHSTNNEAEYGALIKALDIAKSLKYKKIKVFSDSELICNQINGIYKVKNERLKELYAEAKRHICDFSEFSLNYIPREYNKDADKMANMAMNNKKNGEVELTVAGSTEDSR